MQIQVSVRNQAHDSHRDRKANHRSTALSRGQVVRLYEGGEGRLDKSLLRSDASLRLRAARACVEELEAGPLHSWLF